MRTPSSRVGAVMREDKVLVSRDATSNASCTMIQISLFGGGTVVHTHSREDEALVVFQSESASYDGEAWHQLPPALPRYLVRGRAHAYRNIGTTPGRMLVFAAPVSLDHYFAKVALLDCLRIKTGSTISVACTASSSAARSGAATPLLKP